MIRRWLYYENDISAEEALQSKSTRLQGKDEHARRKKSLGSQKVKRKKEIIRVGRSFVAFSSLCKESRKVYGIFGVSEEKCRFSEDI